MRTVSETPNYPIMSNWIGKLGLAVRYAQILQTCLFSRAPLVIVYSLRQVIRFQLLLPNGSCFCQQVISSVL